MAARRDFDAAWRDATATLLQVPVAGMLAADYFVQQWVERTSTFLMQVKTRFELARPGPIEGENVMAGPLSEDLMDAATKLTRGLISLPGEAANVFNRRVEDSVREVLDRVQPDEVTDPRTYVKQELQKLSRDVERLRQVARTAAVHRQREGGGKADPAGDPDVVALEHVLERVQVAIDQKLEASERERPREARPSASREAARARYQEMTLSIQRLLDQVEQLRRERDAGQEGRRRASREIAETRRGSRRR